MAAVVPLAAAQWPWVGFARSFFPNLAGRSLPFAVGSAFLINPAVALTASHVVYDTVNYGGQALQVDLTFPGQPTIRAAEFIPTNEWINQDSANNYAFSAFDIAAIFFNPPLSGVPFVGFDSGVNLPGEITVVGFTGNNYPTVPFYGGTCFPTASSFDAFRISYPLGTLDGMSGSPVYTVDSSNRPTVRGIHTSLPVPDSGNALRFTDGILNLINRTWLGR